MPLRYYQRNAIDSVFSYWREEAGNPLVDMATGTGKSKTMAELIYELISGWAGMRVMNCTHVVELVEGNYKEFIESHPFEPAGLYAAALNQRNATAQVLFAQLQTVWNKAARIGHVDVLVIDEVHLVPNDEGTMYRKLISALILINPDMKIVGFSATVYRLDSGRLDEGEGRLFDKVVYTYDIAQGIEDGYLTPLSSKGMATKFDLSGVRTSMGDYKKGDLSAAIDKAEITRAAIAEAMGYAGGCKTALAFCGGIDHAEHVRDEIRSHGRSCEMVHGGTPRTERRNIIEALKAGKLWGVTNDSVLTTGTNIPGVDLILDLAPTKSTNRYVQKGGRGTRPVYPRGFDPESTDAEGRRDAIARGPKPRCTYLDYAQNVAYHGPIDAVQPRKPGDGKGEAPIKECPACHEQVAISLRVCPCCDTPFEIAPEEKLTRAAADIPILSKAPPETRAVSGRDFFRHESKKDDGQPSVRADFYCGYVPMKTWLCPEHSGFAKSKADRFWRDHGGEAPFPKTVDDWLARQDELAPTAEILVRPEGKFWNVVSMKAGPRPLLKDMPPPTHERAFSDADIPF